MDWAKNLQLFYIHILVLKVLFSFSKNLSHALLDSNKPSNVIYMTEHNTTFKILILQVICVRPKHSSVGVTKRITESVTFFFLYMAEKNVIAKNKLFQMPYLLKRQIQNYKLHRFAHEGLKTL